jgi:hypothetical protein
MEQECVAQLEDHRLSPLPDDALSTFTSEEQADIEGRVRSLLEDWREDHENYYDS